MTTPFFLWLAVILAGMGVAQLVKVGWRAHRSGGSGIRAAGRELIAGRMLLLIGFCVLDLVKARLPR